MGRPLPGERGRTILRLCGRDDFDMLLAAQKATPVRAVGPRPCERSDYAPALVTTGQATKRPGPTSFSVGTSSAQDFCAMGQRVRNAQPEGFARGLGTSP